MNDLLNILTLCINELDRGEGIDDSGQIINWLEDARAFIGKQEKTGAGRIAQERERQVTGEGFMTEHDDAHRDGSLARAGACYASTAAIQSEKHVAQLPPCFIHKDWPWEKQDWRPSNDPLRNLEKAGALIAAEIDRLLRLRGAVK